MKRERANRLGGGRPDVSRGRGRVLVGLLLLAVMWPGLAPPAVVAQEVDPVDRDGAPPAPVDPRPAERDRDGAPEPPPETKAEAAPTPASTSTSICLLIESAAQAHGLPF